MTTRLRAGARGRTTLVVAVVLVALAAVLVSRAWWLSHQTTEQRAAVRALVPSYLSTTPPAPKTAGTTRAVAKGTTVAPKQQPSAAKATPTHPAAFVIIKPINATQIFIPSIRVNNPTQAAASSVQWDKHARSNQPTLQAPTGRKKMDYTTWCSTPAGAIKCPEPGAAGMAIVLGHHQIGGYGVFNRLGELRKGDVGGLSDGKTVLKFQVMKLPVQGIKKSDPARLAYVLQHPPKGARLATITCSGDVDGNSHLDNTVVFWALVGFGSAGK